MAFEEVGGDEGIWSRGTEWLNKGEAGESDITSCCAGDPSGEFGKLGRAVAGGVPLLVALG